MRGRVPALRRNGIVKAGAYQAGITQILHSLNFFGLRRASQPNAVGGDGRDGHAHPQVAEPRGSPRIAHRAVSEGEVG